VADHWLDCAALSDQQLADRIRADGIDLLVDLSGHTAGNRLLRFARKPAPVQLSWIGYPVATGLRQIDYWLTDQRASPPDAESVSLAGDDTELLYRLPGIFCCYRPPNGAPYPERAGAPDARAVTLGSFNNAAKISDSVVRLWSRLLLAQPSFRLLLKDASYADAGACGRMIARFGAHGVDQERLMLLARVPSDAGHLGLYRRVDIALDTFPYCGVTTTCEALWMGVPVVSLAGRTFVSRMGLTLLSAVGHPEWVAMREGDYIGNVLALAADPAQRGALRLGLRAQMQASPLMDEVGFTRELETAYRAMWRRWCSYRSRSSISDASSP
jgi:predicted O-linked N-acetylglucosamine transferase (SPINDLY family)